KLLLLYYTIYRAKLSIYSVNLKGAKPVFRSPRRRFLGVRCRLPEISDENIFPQTIKGLPDKTVRKGKVHPDMAVSMERSAVLPDHAHFYPGTLKRFNIFSMFPAPLRTVQKKHIGTLRHGGFHTRKMLLNESYRIFQIIIQNLAEFIQPFPALRAVGRDQGMHGKHVHGVIVSSRACFCCAVPEIRIVDYVRGSHKTGQVEGFGGSVHGNRAHSRVFGDHLRGDMAESGHGEIRPDFVGDHVHIIFPVQLHQPGNLFPLPYASCRIVGRTEDSRVYVSAGEFFFQIFIINTPDSLLILNKRIEDKIYSVIFRTVSKTYIDRKSTRLNSSHVSISYAVFCLKKKTNICMRVSAWIVSATAAQSW